MTLAALALLLAGCDRCHAAQTEAFAASRHAQARRLPIFVASYTAAMTRWCLQCHQPDGAADGLTCASCHPAPHTAPPKTVPCARCHEFKAPVPGHFEQAAAETLQSTVSEAGGTRCSPCHDPHRALGGHDPGTLAQGASVTSLGDGGFTVRVGATAHRFPTGDPFRRLVVMSCADTECREVLGRKTFSRSFGAPDGGPWVVVRDTTLPSDSTTSFALPVGPHWSARFFYGDPQFERHLPADEVSRDVRAP